MFCNTGSEAVMPAMRFARAVTGREKVVVFSGDYHGQFDEVLIMGKLRGDPAARPIAPGITRSGLANMVVLPCRGASAPQWIQNHADEIAAVVVEPFQSRCPSFRPAEFVRNVRDITAETGSAFVMDEVVTGFRTHLRGMQGVWDIKADLACYGKVLGGGMPVGLLAGAAPWMDALDGGNWHYQDESVPEVSPTFFAGTFVRHPLVLAAVEAVLDHLEGEGARLYTEVPALAERLAGKMRAAFDSRGLPDLVEQYASWLVLKTTAADPRAALLYPLLRLDGVHLLDGYPAYLTTAHGVAEIDRIAEVFEWSPDALQSVGILARQNSETRLPPAERKEPELARGVPLTESQQEIWMTRQLGDQPATAYNESVSLRLEGKLDVPALEAAIEHVIRRHEVLRL